MAQRSGEQTNDCINKNDCGDRAVGKHVIANGNLKIDQMFDYAVIDSFVMAGNDDETRLLRKPFRQFLIETPARR